MRIVILVEGKTERVFLPKLREFLQPHLAGKMPRLSVHKYDGRIPKEDKLRRIVDDLLNKRPNANAVIGLTDVYTGTKDFVDAADAKAKMRRWVPDERFFPHAAQHDFEAWLLPYWSTIQKLAGHNLAAPARPPEQVNHNKPPAYVINDMFRTGTRREAYVKTRDALRILRDNKLDDAVAACPELKALVNTILRLSNAAELP